MNTVRVILVVISALSSFGIYAQDTLNVQVDSVLSSQVESVVVQPDAVYQDFLADIILAKAQEYLGVRYAMGGMSHSGMDCSGLVCTSFSAIDYKLPHSSGQLAGMGNFIEADDLMPGDLVFFQNKSKTSVGHVAIVSKVDEGNIYIIHATTHGGVMEEILQNNPYFSQRWLYNKRIIE